MAGNLTAEPTGEMIVTAPADGLPADGPPADDALADDVLVEEVSIDGMCGVY